MIWEWINCYGALVRERDPNWLLTNVISLDLDNLSIAEDPRLISNTECYFRCCKRACPHHFSNRGITVSAALTPQRFDSDLGNPLRALAQLASILGKFLRKIRYLPKSTWEWQSVWREDVLVIWLYDDTKQEGPPEGGPGAGPPAMPGDLHTTYGWFRAYFWTVQAEI